MSPENWAPGLSEAFQTHSLQKALAWAKQTGSPERGPKKKSRRGFTNPPSPPKKGAEGCEALFNLKKLFSSVAKQSLKVNAQLE